LKLSTLKPGRGKAYQSFLPCLALLTFTNIVNYSEELLSKDEKVSDKEPKVVKLIL
jgi:hypothetical protein